ncbi:MAG: hypothetical protein RIB65_05300 [Ilumatobacter fluminis]|uniref:hypothetical protein n=1 Tax=Ilumatobacter fluminis TaxID=467091 RepID=UPI0032EE2E71
MTESRPTITLHSTWRLLLGSWLSAGMLATAGTWAVAMGGFRFIPVVVFLVGWGVLAIVLFDMPMASTFDDHGVVRRAPLRKHRLDFRDGDQLTRTRPSVIGIARSLEHGGLALRRGRRKYLLVDRLESLVEYEALLDVMDADGTPGSEVGADVLPMPNEKIPPTWLYRRRHWRPESAERR